MVNNFLGDEFDEEFHILQIWKDGTVEKFQISALIKAASLVEIVVLRSSFTVERKAATEEPSPLNSSLLTPTVKCTLSFLPYMN